jgi:hypothetical protein
MAPPPLKRRARQAERTRRGTWSSTKEEPPWT